jgi:hypothetical protein
MPDDPTKNSEQAGNSEEESVSEKEENSTAIPAPESQNSDDEIAEAWLAEPSPAAPTRALADLGDVDEFASPQGRSRRQRLLLRLTVILVPMMVVSAVVLAVQTWERGALPWERPPVEDVDWIDLNVEHRGVRVHGVVHLNAGFTLRQRRRTWTGSSQEFEAYLYPFFHPDGWNDKEVRIMLYTTRPPEDSRLEIEEMTIEGFLRPLGPDRWDPLVQVTLEEKGYKFPMPIQENVFVIEEYVD